VVRDRTFAERHLDPGDRLAEVLFGLIMVLTITLGAGVVVKDEPGAARELLVAALGCNIAWGLIDGAFYVMTSLLERARAARLVAAVRQAPDDGAALDVLARSLDDRLEHVGTAADRRRLYELCRDLARRSAAAPEHVRIRKDDLLGAAACFWLVVGATIPAVLPFLVVSPAHTALRVSNAVLLVLLFVCGAFWGRHAGVSTWRAGLVFLGAGLAMVGVAIALGG